MSPKEYKRIARLLKEVYAKMQQEAIDSGLSIASQEFTDLIDKARNMVLSNHGFTVDQYRQIKAKVEAFTSADIMSEVEQIRQAIQDLYIPSQDEIQTIANQEVQKNLKAPEIINRIVKEVTIQKPQIIKETTIEKTIEERNYDAQPILDSISNINKRIDNLPAPQSIDIEAIKSDLKLEFGKMLQHNIDILGMPDFRKLAMGLQGQLDALIPSQAGNSGKFLKTDGKNLSWGTPAGGSGFTLLPATGTIDGNNVAFTFTQQPTYIISDGAWYTVNNGWTWSVLTATMTIPPNDNIWGFV